VVSQHLTTERAEPRSRSGTLGRSTVTPVMRMSPPLRMMRQAGMLVGAGAPLSLNRSSLGDAVARTGRPGAQRSSLFRRCGLLVVRPPVYDLRLWRRSVRCALWRLSRLPPVGGLTDGLRELSKHGWRDQRCPRSRHPKGRCEGLAPMHRSACGRAGVSGPPFWLLLPSHCGATVCEPCVVSFGLSDLCPPAPRGRRARRRPRPQGRGRIHACRLRACTLSK